LTGGVWITRVKWALAKASDWFEGEGDTFPGDVLIEAELFTFHTLPALKTNDPWADEDVIF